MVYILIQYGLVCLSNSQVFINIVIITYTSSCSNSISHFSHSNLVIFMYGFLYSFINVFKVHLLSKIRYIDCVSNFFSIGRSSSRPSFEASGSLDS